MVASHSHGEYLCLHCSSYELPEELCFFTCVCIKHKAPGLSGLVTEMIQATGDTGTQWILDLCNGIVKEGSIPEDWKSSVLVPKVTLWSVDLTEGSNCWNLL